MNQKIRSIVTILGIYVGSILLSAISANIFGMLHSIFLGTTCTDSIFIMANIDKGCRIEGFVYAFIFLLTIFSFSLLKQKTAWIVFIAGTILFWALHIYILISENLKKGNEIVSSLIIMLISFVVGYAIAFGIRRLITLQEK